MIRVSSRRGWLKLQTVEGSLAEKMKEPRSNE
jgi:hypothetical protein